MYQYVIKFAKEGAICYTSHLDLLRLFKRVFKKSGINLAYSQGFNPHPKMGFAQPLSLGYSSVSEYLEFETTDEYEAQVLKAEIQRRMPAGITIFDCIKTENKKKSLAARAESAEYMIAIPLETALDEDVPANDI